MVWYGSPLQVFPSDLNNHAPRLGSSAVSAAVQLACILKVFAFNNHAANHEQMLLF